MQSINAEKRIVFGKKTALLRGQGFLPAVLYGKKKNAEPISVKENEFVKLWKSAGESSLVEVKVGSEKYNALVQDVAVDPLKGGPMHADFYVVEMDKPIKVGVQLEFTGDSEAVKAGGILVKVVHEIKIEALPKDLPHSIAVDISMLKNIGDALTIKDLALPQNVEVLENPDQTVVLAEAPRAEEEIKAEEGASLENIEVVGKKAKEAEADEESASENKEEKKKEAKA